MKRVLLIGNQDFGIAFFKTRTYEDDIKSYVISNREVQVRMGDHIIKIEAANKIIKEFSEDERNIIGYEAPKVFMLTYDSDELLLKILSEYDIPKGLFVDDLGTLIRFEEFINRIKNN